MHKQKKSVFRLLAVSAVAALVAACGGGGGSSAPSTVALSGTAAKGILRGAEVKAYEVINGAQATTALATAITDNNGEYSLKIPSTTNPVVVEVKALSTTKMLDETQVDANGDFAVVPAPADLSMRSFVASAKEEAVVRINPLTEAALQIAAQTLGTDGKPVGLKADVLLAAQEVVRTQLAPQGVNPFIEVPPVKLAGATDEQKKLVAFMAGLMTDSAGDRKADAVLATKIKEIAKGVTLAVGSDGKPTGVSRDAAIALNTLRVDSLNAAAAAKDPDLQSKLSTTVTALATQATRAQTDAQASTTGVTVDVAQLSEAQGFNGFINALRAGFKATQEVLTAKDKVLDETYAKTSFSGSDYLVAAIDSVLNDCRISETVGAIVCTKTAYSGVDWKKSGSTYTGQFTTSMGRVIEGVVTPGTVSAGGASMNITGKVWKDATKAKQLGEIKNLALTASWSGSGATEKVSGTANGSVVLADDASELTMTLETTGLEFGMDAGTGTIKGKTALTVSNGDKLTGDLMVSAKSYKRTQTFPGGNTYTSDEDYVTSMSLTLTASDKSAQVASVAISGKRTPPASLTKAVSKDNWGASEMAVEIALPKSTSLKVVEANSEWATLTQTMTVKTAQEEVVLTGSFGVDTVPANAWCVYTDNVRRCASSMSLTTKGGLYKATLTNTGGKTNGDIKKGDVVVGKVKDGNIEINGTVVSLY